METCHCRVADWRRLRLALGLSIGQMAGVLGVGERTVWALESRARHRCARRQTELILRIVLQQPDLQRRLRLARHPHPWPEDEREVSLPRR